MELREESVKAAERVVNGGTDDVKEKKAPNIIVSTNIVSAVFWDVMIL